MSAPLVVPFNFQPLSVSVKTSSYTIPAGKYAYVENLCGDFSINSSLIGKQLSSSSLTAGTDIAVLGEAFYTYTMTYTGNAGTKSVSIYTQMDSATTVLFSGSLNSNTQSDSDTFYGYNLTIERSITGGSITSGSNTIWSCPRLGMWVNAGDDIDGSKFIVTEYASIT